MDLNESFLKNWADAAHTSLGFFWMALWAFILGYAISGIIQVFVTQERMQKTMGQDDLKSVSLGAFFGFISSSCSFSALATTKSLFQKGAGFVSSIAFLLASTNLVIELGIVISVFLDWQFVVGEYAGGLMLILFSWLLIRLFKPNGLIEKARKNLGKPENSHEKAESFIENISDAKSWAKVGKQYAMEWKMVWKDVTIGFTIAGIISAFVPDAFFQRLFWNTGTGIDDYNFFTLLEHVIVGPVAAFLTFIGSMGNIPLAALLFTKGVSFAGVMAFIFSDLVVFPVLRINARYYGWQMSLFILFLLFSSLIITALTLHYGFDSLNIIPDASTINLSEKTFFAIDYTFWLNMAFFLISGILIYFGFIKGKGIHYHKEMAHKNPTTEMTLKWLALLSYGWLVIGISLKLFMF